MFRSWRSLRLAPFVAAIVITLYGALLRMDALTVRYGWLEHPRWAIELEQSLLPISKTLRPAAVPWQRVDRPYIGGDPASYLYFARHWRHFYQAHVREPVFLAMIHWMLWLMHDSDIAVSYASMIGGTLAIFATFLLGRAAHSTAAGLLAAAALAIELYAIVWAADGWRDDTFMLSVALAGWAYVRLLQRPSWQWGVASGIAGAAACLTRITSLSFVVPALVWIGLRRLPDPGGRFLAARPAAISAAVTAALIAPFLINCWVELGDPFFAINHHTRYYRGHEGLPLDTSVGAFDYVAQKVRERPVATLDTAGVGLFVFPFNNKWTGFQAWSPALASFLKWSAIAGLLLATMSREGRLLWVILITSLVPYSVTWPIGGGAEWRFTQHAYPLYLVAAAAAIVTVSLALWKLIRRQMDWGSWRRVRLKPILALAAGAAIGCTLYALLPLFVLRESLLAGEAVSVGVGDRDFVFFSGDWSRAVGSGAVLVRVAESDRVSMRIPLPVPADYTLTLRMDGPGLADPALQPRVTVFVDRQTVGQVRFSDDPLRVGAYRMKIPRELTGKLFGRLDLVSSHTVRADQSGPRFAWLPGATPVAFYLWYVRLEPVLTDQRINGSTDQRINGSADQRGNGSTVAQREIIPHAARPSDRPVSHGVLAPGSR
jgi:hypothetical protein